MAAQSYQQMIQPIFSAPLQLIEWLAFQQLIQLNFVIKCQYIKRKAIIQYPPQYEFCQYANDSYVYNSYPHNCIDTQPSINSIGNCFNLGMSKAMWNNFVIFCANFRMKDAFVSRKHFSVKTTIQDLNTIDCQTAVNKMGCTSISNPLKVCQYDIQNSTCNEIIALTKPCSSYNNVNASKSSESTSDSACKLDFSIKFAQGVNYQACSIYKRPSFQCKFEKYCYTPTSGYPTCGDSLNKEVCLNFIQFCTWDFQNSQCIEYNLNGQACQKLQDQKTAVSSQVCYNAEVSDGSALFLIYTHLHLNHLTKFLCQTLNHNQCKSQTELAYL
ncbi:unnamed protein product [Paramecium octaurelia]|uniref:Uncharacterized protein n=1 Tax=Paramecium octaurelia TaxID=43137 RepID=A0A8S1WG82_PAROT|nr:unnamed protein product [Paramecium octaurelia]